MLKRESFQVKEECFLNTLEINMKTGLPRITEPDEGLIHFAACSLADAVSLCGLTDFLQAKEAGVPTTKPVTCNLCLAIYSHRRYSARLKLAHD